MGAYTLGIDFGSKHIGLAVVEQPGNLVRELVNVELRDDIKELMDERRALRRTRRQRKRFRQPTEPTRGGGAGRSAQKFRRAKGQNKCLRALCKHVDKQTGVICCKRVPMKKNVRPLLLQNILNYLEINDKLKAEFQDAIDPKKKSDRPLNELLKELEELKVNAEIRKQIRDIFQNALTGRTNFCREHITAHTEQTDIEQPSVWLSNSVMAKHDELIKVLNQLSRKYKISRVVIEEANFDIRMIQEGRTLEPEEYQQGPRYMKKNTFKALQHEFFNRCCYCGVEGKDNVKLVVEHVKPRAQRGGDNWENLVLSCEKCNAEKGEKTPSQAGMRFYVLKGVVIGGIKTNVTLKPRKLEESRSYRHITQTDIGKRMLRNRMKEIFPDAEFEYDYGYRTSFFRNKWEWTKDHCYDAAVLAGDKRDDVPEKAPTLKTDPAEIKFKPGGRKMFDTNPVSKVGDEYFQIMTLVSRDGTTAAFKWKDIKDVVSDEKRRILESLKTKCEPDKLGDKKNIPADLLKMLPFRKVRLKRKDVGDEGVRKLGRNYFKVIEPNWCTAVYIKKNEKKGCFIIKNKKVFGETKSPDDMDRILYVIRKGDMVSFKHKGIMRREKVYANLSNGNLKFFDKVIENEIDGKKKKKNIYISKSAASCTPVRSNIAGGSRSG